MERKAEIAHPRRGRRCEVCALSVDDRTRIETALANGVNFSRISRESPFAPSRDSLRRHVLSGHLPEQLQATAERLAGLDETTVAARVLDASRRAREVGREALEAGDRPTALRAIDTELRSLAALGALGITSEADATLEHQLLELARAVYTMVRDGSQSAAISEALAAGLVARGREDIAEDLLSQRPAEQKESDAL